jgi:GntR family transcriptional regulator of arabinose operon
VEREKSILEDIISRDEVAGIIIEATKSGLPNPNLHLYQELINKKIPILFINSFYPQLPVAHVAMNDRLTGYNATKYLIKRGHKKIGGIFKLDDGQGHLRYAGYMKAMEEAGLPTSDSNIVWVDTEETKNLELSKTKILNRIKNLSAVVCYNDQIAFNLIPMLKEQGITVPENMSLIGIDDSELTGLGDVTITSIPHPTDKLGAKAAKNLLRLIKTPSYEATYEFETQVMERASVLKYMED